MKKFSFFLTAVAVTLVSCNKEQDFTTTESSPVGKTVTIKASHELGSDPESKTALALDGSVTWAAGDKLMVVYNGGSGETSEAEAGATASFTFTAGEGNNYLVYPSGIEASYDGTDFKVTVPAAQDGSFSSAAIEVAQYTGSTCNLKNLGALLEITVDADVDQIILHSNNSTPLVGKATVTFTDGVPSVSSVADGYTSVTLNGLSGAGTYYAAVLPGSYEAGIYVELKKDDSLVGEKISGNTLAVARRQIKPLPVENPGVIANKYFFKADGTGDGSSWDSPYGPSKLSTVLTADSDATLFLAQGTYTLTDEIQMKKGHNYKIYGGYPSSATGTSLANRDFSVETIISGDGSSRLLIPWNASLKLTVDGITLENAKSTSSAVGSALVFESHNGSSINNCIIRNNQTTTSSSAYGGAVRLKGTVKFTNCSFESNTTEKAAGGTIAMISSGSPNLTLENCSFSNNTAPSGYGGAIIAFGGTLVAKNCTFTGCSAGGGGVFRASANTSISASFINCTFDGNFATNAKQNDAEGAMAGSGTGGAVFSLSGASGKQVSLTADNCVFLNNVAHPSKAALTKSSTLKGAAAIASVGHYADVRVKDCLMRYNYAGFAAFVVNSNSTLFLDRCRFWENRGLQDATVIYNNEGKVAVHNSSFQNSANLQTQTDGHENCYFYNTENGAMLLSCCTFRVASATPIIKGSDSTPDNNTVVINNFLGSTNEAGIFDAKAKYKSHGHNVVTTLSNWAGKVASDLDYTATSTNPAKNTTYYCLMASLSGLTFTKATRTDVTTAIEAFDTNNSTGVLTWLGADAVSVDVLKNTRGATEIMPGCYE